MAWVPKEGECEICGEPIVLKSARQKYCRECREMMKKMKRQENRDVEIAMYVARKRGRDPKRYEGKEHECKVKGSCYYGTSKHCDYMAITGRSRLLAGYPIRGGKCVAYKRRHREERRKTPLPQEGNWNIGNLSEV